MENCKHEYYEVSKPYSIGERVTIDEKIGTKRNKPFKCKLCGKIASIEIMTSVFPQHLNNTEHTE